MRSTQRIDISSGTIFRVILIGLAAWFLFVIRDIVLMLLGAIIIASAVEPIANRLQRYKIPRAASVALVYLLVLALLSLIGTLMIPPLTEQIAQLAQALPQVVERLQQWGAIVPSEQVSVIGPLQDLLQQFGQNLANAGFNLFQQTRSVFSGVFSVVLSFIIAFYLVVEKDALKKLFRFIMPRDHVPYTDSLIDRAQKKIGRWVLAQLTLAVIMGVLVGVGLWLLGVRYALLLGILAGVLEIIPVIGPVIAAIPAILVALSQSWLLGLLALAMYVLLQQIENHALVPNIMKRAIGLNPLVVLIAVVLGARLAGVVGVILAVPVATILSIFASDFFTATTAEDELAG